LKQKVSRAFSGKRVDLDVIKKELKDEITHILYDQTRRTPIVIPVINEVGGSGGAPQRDTTKQRAPRPNAAPGNTYRIEDSEQSEPTEEFAAPTPKSFPEPQVPDTAEIDPTVKATERGY